MPDPVLEWKASICLNTQIWAIERYLPNYHLRSSQILILFSYIKLLIGPDCRLVYLEYT